MQTAAMTGMIAACEPQRDSMTDTFRHRLRHATAKAHARLDAQLGELNLSERSDYRRFLEANAAALPPPAPVGLVAAGSFLECQWSVVSGQWSVVKCQFDAQARKRLPLHSGYICRPTIDC